MTDMIAVRLMIAPNTSPVLARLPIVPRVGDEIEVDI